MFNLPESILEWRRQMLAAGIQPPVLEELECHLRDGIDQCIQAGLREPEAFAAAVREMGEARTLTTEFRKARMPLGEYLKRLIHISAGIPNYQLATNMNALNPNLEPRWASYLKNGALIGPGVFVWVGFCIYVVPKLKEVCAASNTVLWKPISLALALSDLIRVNFIPIAVAAIIGIILLEWRSARWPRYRRMILGIIAHTVNILALFLITTLAVLAVVAAANLLHAK